MGLHENYDVDGPGGIGGGRRLRATSGNALGPPDLAQNNRMTLGCMAVGPLPLDILRSRVASGREETADTATDTSSVIRHDLSDGTLNAECARRLISGSDPRV